MTDKEHGGGHGGAVVMNPIETQSMVGDRPENGRNIISENAP